MKLYAISDLHLEIKENRQALEQLPAYPDDWLILGGDIGNNLETLKLALTLCGERFQQVIWVPGNHDLWKESIAGELLLGEKKYQVLVETCQSFGVLTPEDPYVMWAGDGPQCLLAPLFLLYDYSFRPDEISREQAVAWAAAEKIGCTDEYYLDPAPYASREAWCQNRLQYTAAKLKTAALRAPLVLINHYPLRQDLIRFKRLSRFSLWCGTRATENWHLEFPTKVVVSGHLHMRATDYRNGVRFEEVSLGYADHWLHQKGLAGYLREILPGSMAAYENAGPFWHL